VTDREYIAELNDHLSVLPDIERETAVSYYKLVFEKSGNSIDVMLKYGNPYALAKRIISEHSDFNETVQYQNLKRDRMTASSMETAYAETTYAEPERLIVKTADEEIYPKANRSYSDKPSQNAANSINETDSINGTNGYIPPPAASRKSRRRPPWVIDKNNPARRKIRKRRLLLVTAVMMLGFVIIAASIAIVD
jgi:hypothetical protein